MSGFNRRGFIKSTVLTTAGISLFANAAGSPLFNPESIPEGLTVLFQGDSITDAHRDRAAYYANNLRGLGDGYAFLAAAYLLGNHPEVGFQIYNRGISGNKVYQLADRWKEDCLQLQPDVLSILIGVNDFWHTLSGRYKATVEVYERDFRRLLERTKKALPEVKLIVGEPFAVTGGTAIDEQWGTDFDPYRYAAEKIAAEFEAVFIPYHRLFKEALQEAPVEYWCPDGVHPSLAGAHLMAAEWVKAFGKITF